MKSHSPPSGTTQKPSGFLSPDAIFATYLVEAIPTETVRPVFSLTSSLILLAVSMGGPNSRSVPVKSTNASSTEICCTSGE